MISPVAIFRRRPVGRLWHISFVEGHPQWDAMEKRWEAEARVQEAAAGFNPAFR